MGVMSIGPKAGWEKTRLTLLERVRDSGNQGAWSEFFDLYLPPVKATAFRTGLRSDEVDDVVQETMIHVADSMADGKVRYTPGREPFRSWLRRIVRWKIGEQFRKRRKKDRDCSGGSDEAIAGMAEQGAPEAERIWEEEWRSNLISQAMSAVRRQTPPAQFQAFQMFAMDGMGASEVASMLGVGVARVYLWKHRVGKAVKRELTRIHERIEKGELDPPREGSGSRLAEERPPGVSTANGHE